MSEPQFSPSAKSTSLPSGAAARRTNVLQGRRVIVVLETLELGGAERQAIRLAERLIRDYGADVQVWGFADEGRAARACDAAAIPWKLVPANWGEYRTHQWLNAALRFVVLLRKAKAEVLLPYCARSNIICGLSWRLAGAQACVWNQRDEGIGIRPKSLATRWALRAVSAYVANSANTAEYLTETFGVSPQCISVVHNGVELAEPVRSRTEWRQALNIAPNSFVACMLANIHQNKDHATLLRAWRLVLDNWGPRYDGAVLLLAGSVHPHAEWLKDFAEELGLGESVRFLGAIDDVGGLLAASDLGVFSSKSEGCPNGVLECMASALPVAGSDIRGIREALGSADYLAPPEDSTTFARRILFLAHHNDTAATIAKENCSRVRREFSPENMVERMVEVIWSAMNRGKLPRFNAANGRALR